jgi:2-keto-3-deoxygluconate permease
MSAGTRLVAAARGLTGLVVRVDGVWVAAGSSVRRSAGAAARRGATAARARLVGARKRVGDAGRRVAGLPGVVVLAPLTAGALCALERRHLMIGPFTTALGPGGTMHAVALMLVAVGAQIRPGALPRVGARTGVVLAGATVIPAAGALLYGLVAGPAGVGGVSLLAVVAAGVCTSNTLWLALASRYGTAEDVGGGMIASALNTGPALALGVLAVWGAGHGVPVLALVDALAPLGLGFGLGLAWPGCRAPLGRALPVLLASVAFCLGWDLDLRTIAHQFAGGIGLGAGAARVSGGLVAAGWAWVLRRPATVGWAAGGIAVGAVLVPGVVATAEPAWSPYAAAATAQVGLAVLVSGVLAPVLTAWWGRWRTRPSTRRPVRHLHPPRPVDLVGGTRR